MSTSFYTREELLTIGFKSLGEEEVLISRNAKIYGASNIEIGSHVRIDDFCILSGKIFIGNYIHISAYTALYGSDVGIYLEDYTTVSSRCALFAASDDYSGESMTNPMIPDQYRNVIKQELVLEKFSIVGSGCTLLPGARLRQGVSVGCMSMVNKELSEWCIYAGIPCKKIKNRSKNIIELEKELKNNLNKF